MFANWGIRRKMLLGLALLFITLATLSFSSFRGVYAYRGLARAISSRTAELPVATELHQDIANLQVMLLRATNCHADYPYGTDAPELDLQVLRYEFRPGIDRVEQTLDSYQQQLDLQPVEKVPTVISDTRHERETVKRMRTLLRTLVNISNRGDWLLNEVQLDTISEELEELHQLASQLPTFLQQRMNNLARDVRSQYRTWIVLTWVTSVASLILLIVLMWLFNRWVLEPLRLLVHGSRRVAEGDFNHRIRLHSKDEIAELAHAMNNMTRSFQEIYEELDEKVQQRTKEVVRSEQMASVGFLAAGVAHEINNPLASIALCAESLEDRIQDILVQDDTLPDDECSEDVRVLRTYMKMIQDEAFRCKAITERLLDFSRLGDVEKHECDLTELVQGVINMVGHLGKYKEKKVVFNSSDPVFALVNAQEYKQVVLNLLTNALDSLEPDGIVRVSVEASGALAVLRVVDNGCGMTEETREHIFEPFFTRRRDGQGTGLGMSITFQIVNDHGGSIKAHSDGPGHGSTLEVRIPLAYPLEKELGYHHRAA